MAISVICLFLAVPWVDLQCVIVEVLGHTHLRFVHNYVAIVLQRKRQEV